MAAEFSRPLPSKMPKDPKAKDIMERLIKAAELLLERQGERAGDDLEAAYGTDYCFILGRRSEPKSKHWFMLIDEREGVEIVGKVYNDLDDFPDGRVFNLAGAKRVLPLLEKDAAIDLLSEAGE